MTEKKKGRDPLRSIRVPDDKWQAWKKKASKRGLSLTKLIWKRMDGLK